MFLSFFLLFLFFNHFRYSFAPPPPQPSHFSTKLPLPFIVGSINLFLRLVPFSAFPHSLPFFFLSGPFSQIRHRRDRIACQIFQIFDRVEEEPGPIVQLRGRSIEKFVALNAPGQKDLSRERERERERELNGIDFAPPLNQRRI